MKLVRVKTNVGTYVVRDPEVVESHERVGLRGRYKVEAKRAYVEDFEHSGLFWINEFTSVEPMPSQMTMEQAA